MGRAMSKAIKTGGCLCGETRFEASGTPSGTGYCHCRMCQRSSGAPVQPYAIYAPEAVRWSGATPRRYRSSKGAERLFCLRCGSQLGFDDGTGISLNLGCFDEPDTLPPERHIWFESRIAWFEIADDLPRHPRGD